MKRILVLIIILCLTFCVFGPIKANATSGKTADQIQQQITNTYSQALASLGWGSFNGYCGAYVGQQLSILGINTTYCAPNGCDSFDQYKGLTYSTGGYKIAAYPASEYTIASSLNTVSAGGTKSVYDIMVGFQSGYQGNVYGHVCFIHAIIDGVVYYSESFNDFVAEGAVIACSIEAFSNYYLGGGYVFEGTIHFKDTSCSHNYTVKTTDATCTETGLMVHTCSLCGDSYSETIPATGHSYGEWSVDTEASCTLSGIEKKTCSTCGETVSQEVPATGHSYSAKQLGAQCGDYPKTRYTCTVCGDHYDEYSDDIYSDWVTELPEGVDPDTVESRTEYRYQTKQTATGTDSTMDGWTFLDTVYGEWGNAQTTTSRPTEGDTLRITTTVQTAWGYYHWCNYYSNCWNVDSIAYGSPNYWHGYASNVELPAISFPDQGGNQAYGGTGSAASPCGYNFYIWFRNPDADTFSYTYETRELMNRFYKWSDWSAWSEDTIQEDEQTNVETRTLYRYITAEKGEHQYVTVETPPTFAQSGAVTHTCTLCNDVIVDVLPQLEGKVSAWNVSLEDDIHVIFHMNISQSIEDTARVRIHVGEEGYTYLVSDLEKTSDGLYIAGVHIAAAQMSDYIFVTVLNDGCISDTQAYTVRQYADTILADESQSQYHAIVKEMLNYGAAAQDYFDYERKNLANAGVTGAGSVQVPDSVDEELSVTGEADGISLYAASLVFRNKIAVRFYFRCDGNINAYTFSANGNACMPQLKDGSFFVEVADILPQNIDQQVELTVTDGNGESMTVSYSPMNYIVRMNEKGSETLKALVKALYNYHLAAKALSAAA